MLANKMRLTKHQMISRKIEVGKREVAENEGPCENDEGSGRTKGSARFRAAALLPTGNP